jgi:UDP:flavonoid glycosyltransferase YjiC (YdhE family)
MLVVPYAWDQPDNASRIQRNGLGLYLPRTRYNIATATATLQRLLNESRFSSRASDVALQLQCEHGLLNACSAIERVLHTSLVVTNT